MAVSNILKLRSTRGTSEIDLKRYFLRCAILDKATPEEINDAFIVDLKHRVKTATAFLLRYKFLVQTSEVKLQSSPKIVACYLDILTAVTSYLSNFAGIAVSHKSISDNAARHDSLVHLNADWRNWFIDSVLFALVRSGSCKISSVESGPDFTYTYIPTAQPSEVFHLFKLSKVKGVHGSDILSFMLRMVTIAQRPLAYEEIERSFTCHLEDCFNAVKGSLLLEKMLVKSTAGYALLSPFNDCLTLAKEVVQLTIATHSSIMDLTQLSHLTEVGISMKLTNAQRLVITDEVIHTLFLLAVSQLEQEGKIRLIHERNSSGELKTVILNCNIPDFLPPLSLIAGSSV
ncbi:MAG: hypothetical protein Q7S22_05785 [Candidatus Micrarchaeota archaeon]|nr:hypothetical protein [Candidatus Micrarchaeota archaeon]